MKTKISDTVLALKGLWSVPPVSNQPIIRLARWVVYEVETGERCLVGFNLNDQEGRVSTPINGFDSARGRVVTQSGRIYQLVGPPGYDPDGNYVWSHLVATHKVKFRDVTNEYHYSGAEEAGL